MLSGQMTSVEKRAVGSISAVMALRMIGLFMVLPVFTLYANHLRGATPARIGVAMGVYGLSQALFQIPFGALSDRFGRKPLILFGLTLFILGSLLAASASTMWVMIAGRTLQGMGAIGSTLLALMADLTREAERTKSMAIAGMTIGMSFALAMIIGPLLAHWTSVSGIFVLAAVLGLVAITVIIFYTPTPHTLRWHRDTEPERKAFIKLLGDRALMKLNFGILILHAIFTASFIVIPITLQLQAKLAPAEHWHLYLPALILACLFSLTCIGYAERKQQVKPFFIAGISTLFIAEMLLWLAPGTRLSLGFALTLFFAGFTLLEAFLPSLISRTAPAYRKGSALGIYSCAQFFGIFLGGALGGLLYGKFHFAGVYLFCMMAAIAWLIFAILMQPPRYLMTQTWRISPAQQATWETAAMQLQTLPGMVEVTYIAEEGIAYLKMEKTTAQHPALIKLKEQLMETH